MSLYTKYRPKDWNSVVGQENIVTILRSSLKNNKTSHAYIFTGTRGTGKTTSARILAKALNCTNLQDGNPCHNCENCQAFDNGNMLDVIEIDAASTTGVENIRKLIEDAIFQPLQGKFKVYIIDEVHMLSIGAFNALLKTLEEPPSHVKFILATTEIHRVLETIQSRSHRFDFQKISKENISSVLKKICENENIKYDEKSIDLIAELARGGMRDALKILEQFSSSGELNYEDIKRSFSILDDNFIEEIVETLKNKENQKLQDIFEKIKKENIEIQSFFDQILIKIKNKMFENLANENFAKYNKIFEIFRLSYNSIKTISDANLLLEITLLRAIAVDFYENPNQNNFPKIQKNNINFEEKKSEKIEKKIEEKRENEEKIFIKKVENNFQNKENIIKENTFVKPINIENKIEKSEEQNSEKTNNQTIPFNFFKLLSELQKNAPNVSATIKKASFKQNENVLELFFEGNWDINRMKDSKYQVPTITALNKLFGGEWQLEIKPKSNENSGIDISVANDVF